VNQFVLQRSDWTVWWYVVNQFVLGSDSMEEGSDYDNRDYNEEVRGKRKQRKENAKRSIKNKKRTPRVPSQKKTSCPTWCCPSPGIRMYRRRRMTNWTATKRNLLQPRSIAKPRRWSSYYVSFHYPSKVICCVGDARIGEGANILCQPSRTRKDKIDSVAFIRSGGNFSNDS
jgi:hypothetical protein